MSRKDFVAGYMAARNKKAMPWSYGNGIPSLSNWRHEIDLLGCEVYVCGYDGYWCIIYEDADTGQWGGWMFDKNDFHEIDVNAPFDVYDQNRAIWKVDPVNDNAGSVWAQFSLYFQYQ